MNKIHTISKTFILLTILLCSSLFGYAEASKDSCQANLAEFEATIQKHREQFEANMLKHRQQFEADVTKYTEAYMHNCVGSEVIEEIKKEIIQKEIIKIIEPDSNEKISQATLNQVEFLRMFLNVEPAFKKYDIDSIKYAYAAAVSNDIAAMEYAIKSGFDTNRYIPVLEGSVAMIAAQKGHFEMIEFLLKNGFDIKRKHADQAVIYQAIVNGHLEIVKLLAKAGAALKIHDSEEHHAKGTTTIGKLAERHNHPEITAWYNEFTETETQKSNLDEKSEEL